MFSIIIHSPEQGCREAIKCNDLQLALETFQELAEKLPTTCICLERLLPGDCSPCFEARLPEELPPCSQRSNIEQDEQGDDDH